jgi:hypothetical protein
MRPLTSLKNIGQKSARWLKLVGITSAEDLYEIGAVDAYLRAKNAFPGRVSLNLLYALQGALLDIHWSDLPPSMREKLREEAGVE